MKNKRLNLALVFGGKSPEHEVSIITAFQAIDWVNRQKFKEFLIYIDSDNNCYLCPPPKKRDPKLLIEETLKRGYRVNFKKGGIEYKSGLIKKAFSLDAALLLTHGGTGENGELQGTLDFFDISYTSCGVLESSLCMNKILSKICFEKLGFKVVPYLDFTSGEFKKNQKGITSLIEKKLGFPVFVKPSSSGSSIGITKVSNKKNLPSAIDLASKFGNTILVEKSIEGAVDINCAVMGGKNLKISFCEQPISEDNFLSFEEKYLKGGKNKGMASLSRVIPAPIPNKITEEIMKMSESIFRSMVGHGMARIDFLYQKKTGKVYPNEVNTIPGSLAYYLWKASGIEPDELIEKLVFLAKEKKAETGKLKYFYESKILDQK